jgi:hypothetical protein
LSTQQVNFFLVAWVNGWHPGNVACPPKKSAIEISVEGLNGKALKETER